MRRTRPIKYDMDTVPHQGEFHRSTKPKVYLSTGLGGGKTYSLVMKCFQLMVINWGMPGAILAPDLKMYKKDVKPTIEAICEENHIPYRYNKSDYRWYFPELRTTIDIFHSQDDGDSIRGPNYAWGAINEVTLVTKRAFEHFLARIRLAKSRLLQLAMSGTPEEFNWAYEFFIQEPREDTELIFGRSSDNVFVAKSYFDTLRDNYDEQMQAAYIDGKFVNLLGRSAIYNFNRHRHTRADIERIPGVPVYVSLDFNVDPMGATLWNHCQGFVRDPRTGARAEELRAFDEIKIAGSANTYILCDRLKRILGEDFRDVTIFPDPAGRSRSTKTQVATSDIDILRDYGGFNNIKYRIGGRVRDKVNAVNTAFYKNQIVLNSKKCPETIADLEQTQYIEDAFEFEKRKNPKRTHWLDGMKEMVDYKFPIKRRPGAISQRVR